MALPHSAAAATPSVAAPPATGEAAALARPGALEAGLWLALACATLYALVLGTASILRYQVFGDGGDLADYAQILWNTTQGRLLQITNIYTPGDSLRGGHVEPLLLLLSIPYRVLPDPRSLLVLQTLALAAGAPLVYALARAQGHGQRVSVTLAALYLAIPHVQYANMHEFHPDPFAVPAMLGALLAFEHRRWGALALCLALTLMVKEQMAIFVLGMGAYWWLARGERRIGLLAMGGALLYALAVILPWYLLTADQFAHDYSAFFGGVGQATGGVSTGSGLEARLRSLGAVLADPARRDNIALALLPTGFLFLLDSSALIVLLPLAGLFAGDRQINDIWFHHYLTLVPLIVYGTGRVLRRPALVRRSALLATLLLAWAMVLGALYAEEPVAMMHWIYQPSALAPTDHSRAQDAFIRFVPPAVPLAADAALATHLANRTYLYKLWDQRQILLVPYTLLDTRAGVVDYPRFLFTSNHAELATQAFMERVGGFRVLRADAAHGLYLYANCGGFPRTPGCTGR